MRRASLFLVLISMVFTSCEDFFVNKCFSGEATVVRRSVEVEGEVTRLYILGEADIYLLFNDNQSIEYEFPENLAEDLVFAYNEGDLTIDNKVTCKWRKNNYAPKIYLSLPSIKRFDILDYAPIQCVDTLRYDHHVKFYSFSASDVDLKLNMNSVNIQSDYVADIHVGGKVDKLSMYYKLHGRFFGQDLLAQQISVTHNGENYIHINPIQSLKATIKNYGDLILHNKPPLMEVVDTGEGQLIFANE